MALARVTVDGRPAYRWGDGPVYVYDAADPGSRNAARRRALLYGQVVTACAQRVGDASAWKLREPLAPTPRAYEALLRAYSREVYAWLLAAVVEVARSMRVGDADDDDDPGSVTAETDLQAEAARADLAYAIRARLLSTPPPTPPSPNAIAKVNAPAARQAQRAARSGLVQAGMDLERIALRAGIERGRVLGIDFAPSERDRQVLAAWAKEGTDLAADLPVRYAEQVVRAVREGRAQEWLAAQQGGRGLLPWVRVIARDQIAKLSSRITESTHLQAGVESYIWRTSKDERVRESHRSAAGQVIRWDSQGWPGAGPYGQPAHAGMGIQCRCFADPIIPDED